MKGKKSFKCSACFCNDVHGSSGRKHWGNGCTSPECTGAGAESEDTGREWSFQYRSRL